MKLINLTQHTFSPSQKEGFEAVIDGNEGIKSLLTFTSLPTQEEIVIRASSLAIIARDSKATHAMIGGAPYLMGELEFQLKKYGVQPMYSFTQRESIEKTLEDGTVQKVSIFNHVGWVKV